MGYDGSLRKHRSDGYRAEQEDSFLRSSYTLSWSGKGSHTCPPSALAKPVSHIHSSPDLPPSTSSATSTIPSKRSKDPTHGYPPAAPDWMFSKVLSSHKPRPRQSASPFNSNHAPFEANPPSSFLRRQLSKLASKQASNHSSTTIGNCASQKVRKIQIGRSERRPWT